MHDPLAILLIAVAALAALLLAALTALILAVCSRNRWRSEAADWRRQANRHRRHAVAFRMPASCVPLERGETS